eukprot:1527078-Rhodomonas_salina.1
MLDASGDAFCRRVSCTKHRGSAILLPLATRPTGKTNFPVTQALLKPLAATLLSTGPGLLLSSQSESVTGRGRCQLQSSSGYHRPRPFNSSLGSCPGYFNRDPSITLRLPKCLAPSQSRSRLRVGLGSHWQARGSFKNLNMVPPRRVANTQCMTCICPTRSPVFEAEERENSHK